MPTVQRRAVVLSWLAIVAAAAVAYGNSFTGPLVFDDPGAIATNLSIRHYLTALHPPSSGGTVTGRPVLNLSFAINYAISGTGVWSYHLVNLLLHVLASLTLFGIARRTLEKSGDSSTLTSLAIALIWMVHPLQTESVTYLAQRAESLMGLFYLLTLYGFIRFSEDGRSASTEAESPFSRTAWGALSVCACFFGMETKEVMVSAPVVVFLYDRTFVSGTFRQAWRSFRTYYAALAATWLPLAYLVMAGKSRHGTAGFDIGVSCWQYWLAQFPAITRYLALSVWPNPLVFDYGAQWATSFWAIFPPLLIVVGLAGATFAALVRPGLGARRLGFAGVWFFAILAPTSLVPGLRQTMAEHRMYLALVPLVAWGVLAASRWRPWGTWPALALVPALMGLTALRNQDYRSDLLLWSDTVAKVPGNPFARNNLALALSDRGRLPESIAQYREALRLYPQLAEAHNNLGVALLDANRPDEALVEIEQALRLKPDYAEARNNLGLALARAHQLPAAIAQFEMALRLAPDYAEAHFGLANALIRAARPAEAIPHLEQALRLRPDDAESENELGIGLADAGRLPEAIGHYERALLLRNGYADAENNLGGALADLGRLDQAKAQIEMALRHAPNDPKVRANLGRILAQMDRLPEAVTEYERAMELDPGSPAIHFGLAKALARAGRMPPAIDQYAEALRCQPDYAEAHNNLGNLLVRQGRLTEALTHFQEAARLQPENAGFHANWANALAQSGRTAEAVGQYEEALRINPDLAPVRAALDRLRTELPHTP